MLELPDSIYKRIALFALVPFYVFAGVNHFVNPEFYLAIMPSYLPAHDELIFLSGVFEIIGGIGVLIPRFRSLAGWGLIALLISVFPANVYAAINPELFTDASPILLYARLPFQLVFIAWAYWATQP